MSLGDKQRKFTLMIGTLIAYAYEEGYELTFGDAYRDPRTEYGHPRSLHRSRLAVDFNLFKEGKYLTRTSDHEPLGIYWESIGGTWGGRFEDGGHYSLEHGGMS